MQFNLQVTVGDGEQFGFTADEAAAKVIEALGGDAARDFAQVSVTQAVSGSAGTPAPLAPMPGEPGYGE